MSWSSTASRIPHVFEAIFSNMTLKDRLMASQVCPEWETAILSCSELTNSLALNVLRMVGLRQRLIGLEEIIRSRRLYGSIIIAPRGAPYLNWEKLKNVLELCNLKCPVTWVRIDGTYDVENKIIVPSALATFGSIFSNLQHLELTLTLYSYKESAWGVAFENFLNLQTLIMCNGHGKALESAQRFCRNLRKLTLKRFALTKPLCELIDFPLLEELIIDELDASSHLDLRYGPSKRLFTHLKHLTLLVAYSAHFEHLELMPVVIEAPLLETAFVTDLLHDFVQVIPGNEFHQLTLNVTTFHSEYFVASRIFQQPATSVTTVIVETSLLRPVAELALVFAIKQCPKAQNLFIHQCLEPYEVNKIRLFAGRVMPGLTNIKSKKREFKHRSFCL